MKDILKIVLLNKIKLVNIYLYLKQTNSIFLLTNNTLLIIVQGVPKSIFKEQKIRQHQTVTAFTLVMIFDILNVM